MTHRKGKHIALTDGLEGLLGRLDRKSSGAGTAAKVAALWEQIAGQVVSSHTTGVHIRDGVLVVYVDSHARANDLAAFSERYRIEINKGLGKELVNKVSFSVSRKVSQDRALQEAAAKAEEFDQEDKVESVPLTEIERAQVVESASVIEDDELREAVIRATIKDLEWKKGISSHSSREGARDGL
ncbi:MAG: DUF721 domain-containing protein [Coriobacteriia bacterium]|nr:DUF721 domain-containing protein [Coriobacteriia bacterium]